MKLGTVFPHRQRKVPRDPSSLLERCTSKLKREVTLDEIQLKEFECTEAAYNEA